MLSRVVWRHVVSIMVYIRVIVVVDTVSRDHRDALSASFRADTINLSTQKRSINFRRKFSDALVCRCPKGTIILRIICIMPTGIHVNHFDKPNSNSLRSTRSSISLCIYSPPQRLTWCHLLVDPIQAVIYLRDFSTTES